MTQHLYFVTSHLCCEHNTMQHHLWCAEVAPPTSFIQCARFSTAWWSVGELQAKQAVPPSNIDIKYQSWLLENENTTTTTIPSYKYKCVSIYWYISKQKKCTLKRIPWWLKRRRKLMLLIRFFIGPLRWNPLQRGKKGSWQYDPGSRGFDQPPCHPSRRCQKIQK